MIRIPQLIIMPMLTLTMIVSRKLMKYSRLVLLSAVCLLAGCAEEPEFSSAPPIDVGLTDDESAPPPDTSAEEMVTRPDTQPAGDSTTETPLKDTLPSAEDEYPDVDFTASAETLVREYGEDRNAWKKKYNYKTGEISGTVSGYSSSFIQGHSGFSIKLEGGDEDVEVTLTEETPWVKYLPGSSLTVRGKAKTAGGLEVNKGLVVSSTDGDQLPKFTIEGLLEATASERFPDTPGLKRGDWMLLSGSVFKRDDSYDENAILHLGNEDQNLQIWTAGGSSGNYDFRQCRNLKAGDEVTFLARYRSRDDESCIISPAFLMNPLPKLPLLPAKASRANADGLPFDHLIFSADLLGEWQNTDPRALERVVERNGSYAQTELTGEVKEIIPSEYDEDIVKIYVNNTAGADIQCWVKKKDLPPGFKQGSRFSARGALNIELEYAYLNEPEIYLH